MCMCVHYSEEKIAQAKGRPAREQFGIVRLTQEIGGLQWQISMAMAWDGQAAS